MCGLMVTKWGWPVPLAIVGAIGIGILIGMVNATLVVVVGISGFVATLGTMTILEGLSIAVSNSQIVIGLPPGMLKLGQSVVHGVPVAVVYGLVAAAVVWYVFRFVPYGRYLLFVGGNPDASRLAGIPVARIRFSSLVICGMIAGIASVVLLTTYGAVNPSGASEFLIAPYTAAFLGIAAVQIGRFNVVGTIFALYLVTVGVTGLQLLGAQQWVTSVFDGAVLVLAVGLSRLLGAKRAGA
jgi:ribose transport system permease protein